MAPAVPEDSLSLFVVTMKKKRPNDSAAFHASASTTIESKAEREVSAILDAVRINGSVSTSEASSLLGVSTATAYRRIKEMVGKGVLKQNERQGRSTRYERA